MWSRPETDEILVQRLLPGSSSSPSERALAWAEWQMDVGAAAVLKFIQLNNYTREPDDDIFQEAMLTAYLEVERGRYTPREGVPFTAYVKGIARNKIREARRRERYLTSLEELSYPPGEISLRQLEQSVEQHEQREALQQGLSTLPAQRRQVLEHYIRGESTGEIAARLAISEDLVRQHKCRGLRSLRLHCLSAPGLPGQPGFRNQ